MPLIRFMLYSEISVALCALGLGALGQLMLKSQVDWAILGLISSTTFLFYTAERNLTRPEPEQAIFPEKSRWLADHRGINLGLLLGGALFSIALTPRLSFSNLLGLGGFGVFAVCYSIIPFPRSVPGQPPLGLKRFSWLKSFSMVLVWTYMTLLLPALEIGNFLRAELLVLGLIWVGWIFGNSLLFDIRDLEVDRLQGCLTLAAKLGRRKAHQLIYFLGFFELALILVYGQLFNEPWSWVMMFTSLAFLVFNRLSEKRETLGLGFYTLADLTLILPTLVLGLQYYSSL
ncbi:MAG: hypothetical protein A2527_11325 [Candidatus Lambdaproteobacteria bacterium RIFOXYD2_FULL_50_16]|uniref:UbiA prenyltransferase n=1 Tax=Candidatus Lambdaproteobacteria bacterium RIFOXYD2_FULL_50_16 TaxID=1817772 RepID=A0A1F6G6G9_9PROT|nr:MAG: hypothetical protein A2527_11325 [Candidatus Lambdaproteobacteria bacterium RIFOXYD2_FULL_50_16]